MPGPRAGRPAARLLPCSSRGPILSATRPGRPSGSPARSTAHTNRRPWPARQGRFACGGAGPDRPGAPRSRAEETPPWSSSWHPTPPTRTSPASSSGSRRSAARRSSARAWSARSSAWSATSTPSTTSTCAPCPASRTCTGSPTPTSWSAASTTPTARPSGSARRAPGADRPGHVHVHRRPVRRRDARADPRGRPDGPGRRRHAAARRGVQAAHLAVRLPGPRRRRAWRSSPTSARRPACRSSPRWSTRATCRSSPSTPTCCRSAPATWPTSGCSRPSARPASRCCSSAG